MNTSWLDHVARWMDALQTIGWPGWLLFIILYAVACLFFVPGSILTLGAGAVYGFWGGVALVLMGNGLSAFLSLLITRYLLRDWAKRFFSRNPKLRALEGTVGKEGWKIISLTHLSPIMPFGLVNYAFGLTQISLVEFLLATELGSLPSVVVYVYMGSFLGDFAKIGLEIRHPGLPERLVQGLGLIATVAIAIYVSRMASRALKKQIDHQE